MQTASADRRRHPRYGVRLPVQYHVSQKGRMARSGGGLTLNMSSNGISFRCRGPLPVGAHIEIVVDWPVKCGDLYPVDLVITGIIVRSSAHHVAVRMTSRKFRVMEVSEAPILALA